jgi:Caspase domain
MEDRGATTLNKNDLAELVGEFNCNYIMLIDACHSGSFAKGIDISGGKDIAFDFVREQNMANEKLLRALNASDKANIVIGSSSSSEKSDEWVSCQNGYFTQSILDALEGKIVVDSKTKKEYSPDRDKNGFIYTNELDDYLKEVVAIHTRENAINQSVISKQSPGFNFPIAKLPDADDDGFADRYDGCPTEKGTASGCPDADGDNVADKADNCPNEAGSKDNKGCPIGAAKVIYKNNVNYSLYQKGMTKTLLFPGSGEKLISGKTDKLWLGKVGYGAIGLGLASAVLSASAFNKYKTAKNQADIDKNRNNAKLFSVGSIAMAGVSLGAWAIGISSYSKLRKTKLAINENGIGIQITCR